VIGEKLIGGTGDNSGSILAKNRVGQDNEILGRGNLGTVTIGAGLTGGAGANSGRIEAAGNLASLTVTGPMVGSAGNADPSVIAGAHIGSIALQSGATEAVIRAGRDISSIVIDGNVSGTTISAVGQATPFLPTGDVAIATILVRGNVSGSQILAGYDVDGSAVNADASIGTVRVVGNWSASDIVAGVIDAGSTGFGDAGDTKITGETDRVGFVSQIARITVTGAITGTADAGDHYGFIAQRILALKAGSTTLAFNLAAGDQSFELLPSTTNDVTAREVAV
jgi:hypothetical protein